MDLDRETVWQIGATVAAVVLFVVALAVLSQVFVNDVAVENEPVSGELDGDIQDMTVQDGSVTGTFDGELEGDFQGNLSKDFDVELTANVEGTVGDGTMTGTLEDDVEQPVEGTISGDVENGTLDTETGELTGEFSGTVNGTTEQVSPDGGIALVALIGAFIVAMPLIGYVIRRATHEDEE